MNRNFKLEKLSNGETFITNEKGNSILFTKYKKYNDFKLISIIKPTTKQNNI